MPEPVTMTAILGGAVVNIVCGLATNCMEPQRKVLWGGVSDWWTRGKTQENHDVLKATHAAYVAAMAKMASAASTIAFTDEERDAASALTALVANPTFADFRWDGEHLPLDACQQRIETLFAGRHMPGSEDDGWRTYNRLIVTDLAAWGVDLPPALAALFIDGHEPDAPWHLAFRHAFAEQLKADEKHPEGERAFRILTFERLNELTVGGAVLVEGVAELRAKLDRLQAGQDADRARDENYQAETATLLRQLVAVSQNGARERGVTDAALLALASRVAENVSDPAQALTELHRAIDDLIRLRDAAERGTNLGALVDEVLRRMAAANAEGRIDDAAKAGQRAYSDWQDQQAAAKQAGLRLIDANIEQQRLRFDAERMAHWICERLRLENGGKLATVDLQAEQDIWYKRGSRQGLWLDLDVSIALAEAQVAAATDKVDRAVGLNNLGVALNVQGERREGDAGLAMLASAIGSYRAGIELVDRNAALGLWAMMQSNLGNALRVQGERSEGNPSLESLALAVVACEEALEIYSSDATPSKWAMAQNNLAISLETQGDRIESEVGNALLKRAIAAYEAALEVTDPRDNPEAWGMLQDNLAGALFRLASRTSEKIRVQMTERALKAFDLALEVRTRSEMPAQWALTKENVAVALLMVSCWKTGAPALNDAIAARDACLSALSIYTPNDMPFHFAKASRTLASIDARIAELS